MKLKHSIDLKSYQGLNLFKVDTLISEIISKGIRNLYSVILFCGMVKKKDKHTNKHINQVKNQC
jgi:hypothetical protein